ncbi:hypothetical protein Q2366_26720, partial [Escherichia coli]|nr:hypothetical protein [Escherichia coli]
LSACEPPFLSSDKTPYVDHIEGHSPAISIEQKTTFLNPRSTVGKITEIHDYFRLLNARVDQPCSLDRDVRLSGHTVRQMVDNELSQPAGKRLM